MNINNTEGKSPESLSLRGRLGFLFRDSVLYGGAAAISKAFSLISFPLLARYFSTADYGVLDYFLVLSGLLAVFFIFGQDSAVARYFYEHEDKYSRKQLISQSLLYQFSGLILMLPLLWYESDKITAFLLSASAGASMFKIVLLQLPFLLLINFSQNLLKWTFKRLQFLTMSLLVTIIQVSLLVLALLVFKVNLIDILIINLSVSFIFGLVGLYLIREWLIWPKNFKYLLEMLPFAVPYGAICVAAAFLPALERIMTDRMLGSEELGLYAIANKIAMLVALPTSAFQTAWGPFSLSIYRQSDSGKTYNWVFKIFSLGICVVVLLIAIISRPLIHILAGGRYDAAVICVFPLAIGLGIQAIGWITEIGIGISKRSYLSLYAYILSILISFSSMWLLTPWLKLFGVALSVLLGHIGKTIISSYLAQRNFQLPWQYQPVIFLVIITTIGGLSSILATYYYGYMVGDSVIGGSLFLVLIFGWFILFTEKERANLILIVKKRIFK